ncbi:hypothetical protein DOY81_004184 [Sarcophaga bullata]|nr:hypothetical protein DOY81_004184 [Sarcophaga bullata]
MRCCLSNFGRFTTISLLQMLVMQFLLNHQQLKTSIISSTFLLKQKIFKNINKTTTNTLKIVSQNKFKQLRRIFLL